MTILAQERQHTKEMGVNMTNEAYRIFVKNARMESAIATKIRDFSFMREAKARIMEELCKVVDAFDNAVNPFGNSEVVLRDQGDYADKVGVEVMRCMPLARICLYTKTFELRHVVDGISGKYSYSAVDNIGQTSGFTLINHYCENNEEFVFLRYVVDDVKHPENIELRISLKTGMAWKACHGEKAKIATQKEIKSMIGHLKRMIKKVNREILDHMIDKKM